MIRMADRLKDLVGTDLAVGILEFAFVIQTLLHYQYKFLVRPLLSVAGC